MDRDFDITASHLATGLARMAVAVHVAEGEPHPGPERTLAQQQILLMLSRRHEAYPLAELSTDLGMTTQVTLAAIDALSREGLVTMVPAPSYSPLDMVVSLTERGRASSPELLNWAAKLLTELHSLDDDSQRRLLTVVTEQIRRMQRNGQIPVTKMCVTCRFFDGYAHPGSLEPHHCWLVDSAFGHLQLRLRCPEAIPSDGGSSADGQSAVATAG